MARLTIEQAILHYPAFTQEDIALLTDLSIAQVRSHLKRAGLELCNNVTPEWRREISLEDLTHEKIAKKHHAPLLVIKSAIYCEPPKGRKEVSYQHIINFMLTNKGKHTQLELAEKFGVSQALISKLNPFKRVHGPIERKSPGEQLKIVEYAEKHSIQAAALTFGVSRAAIYRWKEKIDERRANSQQAAKRALP